MTTIRPEGSYPTYSNLSMYSTGGPLCSPISAQDLAHQAADALGLEEDYEALSPLKKYVITHNIFVLVLRACASRVCVVQQLKNKNFTTKLRE